MKIQKKNSSCNDNDIMKFLYTVVLKSQ